MKRLLTTTLALVFAAGIGCKSNEDPGFDAYFNTAQYVLSGDDLDGQRERMLDDIRGSETKVHAAFSRLTDETIADALIAAHENDVEVKVVGDADFADDAGFQSLRDAGVPVTFGDGELRYLPDPTLSPVLVDCALKDAGFVQCPGGLQGEFLDPPSDGLMVRPGHMNLMSHNFVVLDEVTVWNFSAPLTDAKTVALGWRVESEEMHEAFEREFNQLFAGVFATTLDIYNGPLKSMVQNSHYYLTDSYVTDRGEFLLRFNPQQRLVKSLIDEIYRARGSVYLMTDNLAEDFMLDALEYKEKNGFDVRVVVREGGQSGFTKDRVEALESIRYAPDSYDYLPTIVVIDQEPDRNGRERQRRIMVVSHPILRTSSFEVESQQLGDIAKVYPSDYFSDGLLWSLLEYRGQIGENEIIDRVAGRFDSVWKESESP